MLIVPGWSNSGPGHWQSEWQRANPDWRRVEQSNWAQPDPDAWIAAVASAIDSCQAAPVLVAHSLGALVVAQLAAHRAAVRVRAAMLVAPPDVERADTPPPLRCFAPLPLDPLPFPALLVASRTDPFVSWSRAAQLATAWKVRLHDAGDAGHINTAAGFGPWPEGRRLLEGLAGT